MAQENVRALHEALRGLETVMLTTIDERYQLVSRPMTIQVDDHFEGVLRLFAHKDSRAVANISARAAVNVSHASTATSLSIAGQAHIIDDCYEVALNWHRRLDLWFPYGRSGVRLIEITVFEGRCWKLPETSLREQQLTS